MNYLCHINVKRDIENVITALSINIWKQIYKYNNIVR